MKKVQLILLLLGAFSLDQLRAQSDPLPKLSATEAVADVKFLSDLFFQSHINLSFVADTEHLRFCLDTLVAGLNDSISTSQLYVRLAPVFGQIRDIHCALGLPAESNDYLKNGGLYLPLAVFVIDSNLYAKNDMEQLIPFGAEILSINGVKSDEIVKTLLAISSSEGDNVYSRSEIAEIGFTSRFPLFFHVDSINVVEYYSDSTSHFDTILGVDRNQYANQRFFDTAFVAEKNPFQLGYTSDSTIAYMRIASFMGGGFGEYRRFLSASFRYINHYSPSCLVLDLRNNGGGYADFGKLLCRHLIDAPFTYIDNIVAKSSKMVLREMLRQSPMQPELYKLMSTTFGSKPLRTIFSDVDERIDTIPQKQAMPFRSKEVYSGFLVVAFNGLSASTTGMVCNVLRNRPNTVFVGQPAGCAVSGTFGQPTSFELPNSGIVGQISILRFNQTKDEPSLIPIEPDVFLEDFPTGFSTEKDPQLLEMLRWIRQKLKN
jgi:hypothetical protein